MAEMYQQSDNSQNSPVTDYSLLLPGQVMSQNAESYASCSESARFTSHTATGCIEGCIAD